MPIKFANGTSIGPVTIVCATVMFLAMIASFVTLCLYGNAAQVSSFVRPLIPTFATIGSALLVYVKTHNVQTTAIQQGQQATTSAAEAKTAVQHVSEQVTATQAKLNGELDGRIQAAVAAALEAKTVLPAETTVPVISPPPVIHPKGK